jgi:hypothetical protein
MSRGAVAPAATAWQNRIVGHGDEPPEQLLANPANWRLHPPAQRNALRGSLDTVGWVATVLVNRTTGHVVDGHARIEEALSRHEPTVPVTYVELSENEEALVLATLDPIGAMATTDEAKLNELLAEISVDEPGLARLLSDLGQNKPHFADPDALPDETECTVQPGDLWLLGVFYECECGTRTELPPVPEALRANPLQPEVLQRSVPARPDSVPSGRVEEHAEGPRSGDAVAQEPDEEAARSGLPGDGTRAGDGARSDSAARGQEPVPPDAQAPERHGGVQAHPDGDAGERRSVRGVRDDERSDARPHRPDVVGRTARTRQPTGPVPELQRQPGAGGHPLCGGCGKQLTVAERRSQHRIVCGDATNGEDVARLRAGATPRLLATDRPYGVSLDPTWRDHLYDGLGTGSVLARTHLSRRGKRKG